MVYYLNSNFRSKDKFSLNGSNIIQTIGGNITNEKSEDIFYLVGDEVDKERLYKNLKIFVMRGDNNNINEIYHDKNEVYNPKIKLVSFNNRKLNTILFAGDFRSSQDEKNIVCITYDNCEFKEMFNSLTYNFSSDKNIERKKRDLYEYETEEIYCTIKSKDRNRNNKESYNYIIDCRLAYDLDNEDYSLILYRKLKSGFVDEVELEYKDNMFREKSYSINVN